MLSSFSRTARLKHWLSRPALKECKTVFDKALGILSNTDLEEDIASSAFGPVPDALRAIISDRQVALRARHKFDNVFYSRRSTHVGNSQIMFYPRGNLAASPLPGTIEYIIVRHDSSIAYAIRRQLSSAPGTIDPFITYPHFRATIYSPSLSNTLELISPEWVMCHYACWNMDSDQAVVLTLSRAGARNLTNSFILELLSTLDRLTLLVAPTNVLSVILGCGTRQAGGGHSHIHFTSMSHRDTFPLAWDVLWYIFKLIADMKLKEEEKYPALCTLRNASQVCSSWRKLVLGSPSLWARSLNINSLLRGTDMWTEAVIHRTGTAYLEIHVTRPDGDLDNPGFLQPAMDMLEHIVQAHWERIRTLDIDMAEFSSSMPSLFKRPAPCLQAFKICCDRWPSSFSPDFDIFPNAAPVLQTFKLYYRRGATLNITRLPGHNLRCLVLQKLTAISELPHALTLMPVLEILNVSVGSTERVQTHYPNPIILPKLKKIAFRIYGGVDFVLFLLKQISPANCCRLYISGCYLEDSPVSKSVDLYQDIISVHLGRCIHLATATSLRLFFEEDTLNISVKPPSHHRFVFDLVSARAHYPANTIPTLLSSVKAIQFNKITHGDLIFYPDWMLSFTADLQKLIKAFVSIETLRTDSQTLRFLHDTQSSSQGVIMPKLDAIVLASITEPETLGFVKCFLRFRIEGRVPIVRLGIPKYYFEPRIQDDDDATPYLALPEEFDSLIVGASQFPTSY
ncbi:hypothetical protein GALMADRAFT_141601 [Galerina marginata CBS 339.88]|uniref:F-box domain-containing protein n=1 Tax=Galerina marginata (strain CBS 339.88) TaxID=685588 RepID=A0A067T3T5_GALM3|nr:hypothetical protein GALMADRAFT_141601 [Galerina marginata CBS 339.88]